MSYEQIARALGISAMRVRQIEQRALKKCLKRLLKAGVKAADVRHGGAL